MKHLSLLLSSILCIGNFVSVGSVSAMATTPSTTRPALVRMSKRTLNKQVRKTWRHVTTTTKGF